MRGLAAVLAIALLARAIGVGDRSFWLDEAATIDAVRAADLGGLVDAVRDHDPGKGPLYYALLRAWVSVFGEGEAALRWPSVLAGTAAAAAVYVWARELLRREATVPAAAQWGALAAGAFAALNPVLIGLSREARSYAFSHAAAFVAAACTVPAYLGGASERGRRRASVAAPLLGGIAIGGHILAAPFVAATFLGAAVLARRRALSIGPVVRGALLAGVVAALQVPFMGWHPAVDLASGAGFVRLTTRDLAHASLVLFGGSPAAWGCWVLLLAGVVVARRLETVRLALVAGVLPVAAVVAIDRLWVPLLETGDRYVAWGVAPAALVVGALVAASRPRAVLAAAATLAAAAAGAAAGRLHERRHAEDWRGVATLLTDGVRDVDVVVCCAGYVGGPLALYYAGPAPIAGPNELTPAWAAGSAEVQNALAAGGRVWLVWSHAGELSPARLADLESVWGRSAEVHRETAIVVLKFGG